MIKIFFSIIIVLFTVSVFSQTTSKIVLGQDKIFGQYGDEPSSSVKTTVKQDDQITDMLKKHISINKKSRGISGWRVQIYFSSGRTAMEKANDLKLEFEEEYPDIPIYVVYQAPYFKVRIGNFRKSEKTKAIKLKKEISDKYPTTWIVEDLIELPRL